MSDNHVESMAELANDIVLMRAELCMAVGGAFAGAGPIINKIEKFYAQGGDSREAAEMVLVSFCSTFAATLAHHIAGDTEARQRLCLQTAETITKAAFQSLDEIQIERVKISARVNLSIKRDEVAP